MLSPAGDIVPRPHYVYKEMDADIMIGVHFLILIFFVLFAAGFSIGSSNLSEAALAACIAKAGSVSLTVPGGKRLRALPARSDTAFT